MATRLRVVARGWAELKAHLLRGDGREHAAFLLATFARRGKDVEVLAHRCLAVPDEDLVGGAEEHHLEIGSDALVRAVNLAVQQGAGLVEVHNHGPDFPARFSRWDLAGFREVVPYMQSSLPGGSYGALVLGGERNVDGLVWMDDEEQPTHVESVEVLEANRVIVPTTYAQERGGATKRLSADALARFDRQVRAFGRDGQMELARLRVGIAGLGGLGTIVLEELLQGGVEDFVLVDYDRVEESNLTRTALFRSADVGMKKVEALRERARELSPTARVRAVPESLFAPDALEALADVDIIVGCTDDSATRYALNELSLRTLRPYLDLASEIHTENLGLAGYGGRVTFALPGEGCLLCARAIDPREANDEMRPRSCRQAEERAGYITGAREPAAAVRSVNGVVASLGVLELQAWATGIRPSVRQTLLDGVAGEARQLRFKASPKCLACSEFMSIGWDDAFLDRYSALSPS